VKGTYNTLVYAPTGQLHNDTTSCIIKMPSGLSTRQLFPPHDKHLLPRSLHMHPG